ncbi:hypothetical protein VF21_06479 [Pseudogymnoascus sp. 05NY08]|nr:hypothetical protein VF21_06479 [Pseudogymnoascus sp. 05NY08]
MKFASLCYIAALAPLLSSACLLPEERAGLPRKVPLLRRQSNGIAIGTGDRYSGGTIAPRGVGSQTVTLTSLLNVDEIASGLKGLASIYGISTFTTPYTTYNGATISNGKVGGNGTCNNAYRVYLNSSIHARERGASDGLLFFIGDLLYANKNNTALSTGIVFIPLSNPDGVAYDQSSNSCWRKNRNPASSGGSASSIGVDLNRNFDFIWDLTWWASSVRSEVASTSPSSEVFHGTAAFSEPETKSIKWVMDTFSKSKTSTMNFLNSAYNSVRGILSDTPGTNGRYGEYTPAAENTDNIKAATRIGSAMSTTAARTYSVILAAGLYPTSGASDDYSYSRHFADTSKNLIHGYTVEFGFGNSAASCPFYPTQAQHNSNIKEIGAGFMELLLAAAEIGLGKTTAC